jgi:PAS domain S-box-containing protein
MSATTDAQTLQAENDGLQRRVAALEAGLRERDLMLNGIMSNWPAVIYVKNPEGRLLQVNRLYGQIMGREPDELIGKTESELFPRDLVAAWHESDRQLFATGQPLQFENVFQIDGEARDFLTMQFPLYDDQGAPYAICGVSTDVTELRRGERERKALQDQIIATQEAALRELSTPLIPLADGVVLMPLIGAMNGGRVQQVVETLLEGVTAYTAGIAILDITGLLDVDAEVANALLQATQAVKLLGAEMVLTGIGPRVAQTLIEIGADLHRIVTPGTLQDGITYALQRRNEI